MTQEQTLPERATRIQMGEKELVLVGTAHVSKQSVEDVRVTIEQVRPDTVCVELCPARYEALTQKDNWEKLDIFKVLKRKKAVFLLAQLIMTSFYRQLGEKLGVQPGAEMLEGIHKADEIGAQLVLADRNIEITLKRVWGYLGFWSKLKLMMHLMISLCVGEEIDEKLIEQLKEKDQFESIMSEFAEKFPAIKERLIDERDIYLAEKIRTAPGQTIVAVVGAGHVPGLKQQVHHEHDLARLMELPKKSRWGKVIKWAVPLLILAILVYGFTKGKEHGLENIYIWVGVNGVLSAAGAALACAHPLTIVSAFVAAPLTSLNPFFAAGWVAGIVQALIKKPKVRDLEDLPEAIATLKGFWTNPVTRILLVVALANLGSVIGTYVAGVWISARSVG